MFAVIFAVHPGPGKKDDYLALAKHLKPLLEKIDGFIDNERFESTQRAGWILSLSTWRDEKAVVRWRTLDEHHRVQEKGRAEIFDDYRLRVGEVTADTDPPEGYSIEAQRFDATRVGAATVCTVTEVTPPGTAPAPRVQASLAEQLGLDREREGCVGTEVFESITHAGKALLLVDWKDAASAQRWKPVAAAPGSALRHRQVRVIRVYGMRERDEAPQYYPATSR